MNNPLRIAFGSLGNLFFTDTSNNRIRRVDAVAGIITTNAAGDLIVADTFHNANPADRGPTIP